MSSDKETLKDASRITLKTAKSSPSDGKRRKMSDLSQGPGILEMVAGDGPDEEEEEGNKLNARSSSIIKFYPDWCRRCSCSDETPLSLNATHWEQIKNFFKCPPHGTFARILIMTMIFILFWGFFFYLFRAFSEKVDGRPPKVKPPNRDLNPAWVKGPIFALGVVLATGLVLGVILKRYLNLPPLLAPLILGIVFRNIDALNVFDLMVAFDYRNHCAELKRTRTVTVTNHECEHLQLHSINAWVKPIRIIALGIILTRAGLELSPKQLKKLKGIVPMLAFGPCIVEACTCALVNYLFFNKLKEPGTEPMTVPMCFVGGFALAAVSPAVVVPGALSLKRGGYGIARGVPTLLIAASSIDDVLAISAYSIFLGFAVPSSGLSKWQEYSGGVLGLVIGIIHGMVFGMILHFIPPKNSKNKAEHRIILILLVNIVSVMSYEETFYGSAGSISVLVTSFIAGFGWRSQPHWKRPMKKIEKFLALLWMMWVPLLFGTIGKEIDLKSDGFRGMTLGKTFGVILIALVFRLITAFLIAKFATNFNFKECLLVALSWIPKATVQAALAPLVITRADDSPNENIKAHARLVVNVAILAVLVTAPTGSVLIALAGPKLLDKHTEAFVEVESEFPNGEGIDPEESTYALIEQEAKKIKDEETGPEIQEVPLTATAAPTGTAPPQKPSGTKTVLEIATSK